MSWMDFNEYVLMEGAVRDRLDDLHRTTRSRCWRGRDRKDVKMDRDPQLVEALRLRQPTAAERLVATYGDRAYRLATGITGHAQDAEEVVQDAFWTVVQKIDTFRGDSAFGSWLYRIVANAAYQKLRVQRARRRDLSFDEVEMSLDERGQDDEPRADWAARADDPALRSEEHTSELQSRLHLVCRLLLEKKKKRITTQAHTTDVQSRLLQQRRRPRLRKQIQRGGENHGRLRRPRKDEYSTTSEMKVTTSI